jgi:RHS repeat-associated protein
LPCTTDTLTLQEQRTYGYDALGNPTGTGIAVDSANRLLTAHGYTFDYDNDGNLIRKYKTTNTWEFDQYFWWNSIGELDSVWTTRSGVTTKARYGYDGFGRRVRRDVDGQVTRYLYRGEHIAAELDGSGLLTRHYTYYPGVDHPHSVELATGEVFFYMTDGQGHVTGLVEDDATVEAIFQYSPHGEITATGATGIERFRFAGREYDSESGLYFNRLRYYDPQIGRFISEDPIGLAGGINPYVYATNDPINFRDALGTEECEAEGPMMSVRRYADDPHKLEPVVVVEEGPEEDCEEEEERETGGAPPPWPGVVPGPGATTPATAVPPKQTARANGPSCGISHIARQALNGGAVGGVSMAAVGSVIGGLAGAGVGAAAGTAVGTAVGAPSGIGAFVTGFVGGLAGTKTGTAAGIILGAHLGAWGGASTGLAAGALVGFLEGCVFGVSLTPF